MWEMMTEPDCDFPVTMMSDQNDVGILARVDYWLFELQRKENCEMMKKKKKRKEIKIKNV
jgi:hypothetical protein